MSEPSMGCLDCGGVAIPVIRVELTEGAILLTCHRKGPLRAYSGPAIVIGADGRLVAGPDDGEGNHISWPTVRRGQVLTLRFRMWIPRSAPRVIQGQLEGNGNAALPAAGPLALTR